MKPKQQKTTSTKHHTHASQVGSSSINQSSSDLNSIHVSTGVEPKAKSKQATGISSISYIPWLCLCLAFTGLMRIFPNATAIYIGTLGILTAVTCLRFADTKYHWAIGLTVLIPVVQIVSVIFALVLPSDQIRASQASQTTGSSFGLIGWILLGGLIIAVVSIGTVVLFVLLAYFKVTAFR